MTKREKIIGKILELSEKKYPDAEIYLYGSQARGDAKNFSDWDLLILLNSENIPFSLETEIMDYTLFLTRRSSDHRKSVV